MAENEALRKALEHYLQLRLGKLEEVRQFDLMISRLSRDLGEAPPADQKPEAGPEDSMGETWRDKVDVSLAPTGARSNIRADEFVGQTYSGAARSYLEKVGHAVSMDELLEALNRGGCPVGGKDAKKTLYVSLIRDVRTFVPIPGSSGFLGLRKFYPNLKALKERKDEPKTRRKRRVRKKKRAKKVEEAKSKGKPGPKPNGSVQPISVKEKSHLATDQTAQKEA
jgi:hypothetical protein